MVKYDVVQHVVACMAIIRMYLVMAMQVTTCCSK